MARTSNKATTTVPPTPTSTAAPSAPLQERLQERPSTRKSNPVATSTLSTTSNVFSPSDISFDFRIPVICSFNNFLLSFNFNGLPSGPFNEAVKAEKDL